VSTDRINVTFVRSDDLYERAIQVIPLASQTFSKSAMQYVRGASPLFIERGDGCTVWDVDGNSYYDFVLGLLPVVLGYRDADVDDAIRAQLDKGITFSLASPLELELANALIELIPCAEMVRFGKNGSDATTAAVRLARAYTGRDRVACAGYHGWHDWYIGSTTRHLGVPESQRRLTSTFGFNDADSLERLLREDPNGFAAIVLEPATTIGPEAGFLERVRELASRYGAVLVFDEIVTGFRIGLGGAQAHYGVVPDLAAFGKALGNGMPISALVGRREIMRRVDDIFFSGTFGGECLSLAAAIATLDKLKREDAIQKTKAFGTSLKEGVSTLIGNHGLSEHIRIVGPDWWPALALTQDDRVDYLTLTSLLRQELVGAGILQCATFNLCFAQARDGVLSSVLSRWAACLERVNEHLRRPDPRAALLGAPIEPVFKVRAIG
jgi:glutamate-1-semialdehyde 2,1-aminomutase